MDSEETTSSAAEPSPAVAEPAAAGPEQGTLPHVDTAPTGDARGAPRERGGSEETEALDPDVYRVKLDGFEGPLDLLLHLIRKHELDILDIPVGFITEKYLEYMSLMRELSIDVASEYLVMAATLAHIKSKMLLPPDPNAEEDEEGEAGEEADPRAELVRRLLEYQKYRNAAEQLGDRAAVGRDMFPRGSSEPMPEGIAPLAPFNVFKLFDSFERVLKRANQVADHQVLFERVSISDRIIELTELLHDKRRLPFDELFEAVEDEHGPRPPTRLELVVTFLALLEMGKMRVVRIVQDQSLGPIVVELATKRIDGAIPEGPAEPAAMAADDGTADVPAVPESVPEIPDETAPEMALDGAPEMADESEPALAAESTPEMPDESALEPAPESGLP